MIVTTLNVEVKNSKSQSWEEVITIKSLAPVAQILVIVGALNWGLIALADLNLVTALLGEGSMLTRVVYALVGLSAVWIAYEMWGKGGKKK